MLRVIAGTARNLQLKTPDGLDTRPTTDRIRETLFNILQCEVPGSVVIDFFAGSGAIGIESLSRGAEKAYLVDNSRVAVGCITENVKHTKFENKAVILSEDCISAAHHINEKHVDIVFMDPPYGRDLEKQLLSVLKDVPYVDKDTLFVIEGPIKLDFDYVGDMGYTISREKKYKTNKHVFLYRDEA